MNVELFIENNGKIYFPSVLEGIAWNIERKVLPGQLTFDVLKDEALKMAHGNQVSLKVDGKKLFYGFIFSMKNDKEGIVTVSAYDQIRYLKMKTTLTYENKTADELVKMIARDCGLQTGTIEETGWKIASRVESDTTLLDMICTAFDLTLQNKKEMFVLFDDYGKLTLKNISSMTLDVLINNETAENFDYSSSIDSDTYNVIRLKYTDDTTGKNTFYTAKDEESIKKWGILQYYDTLQKGENGKAKADALLKLYNSETRTLSVKGAFGDTRVRAGCMVAVMLNLGDIKVNNYMLVEKVKHTFKESLHTMDLTLRGGKITATA